MNRALCGAQPCLNTFFIPQERPVLDIWRWPYWELDPHFKIGNHFVEVTEPVAHSDMEKRISDMASTRMLSFVRGRA